MANLIKELWQYVKKGSNTSFDVYHNKSVPEANTYLEKFLFATMDEVRVRHANSYARKALEIIDMEDVDHFRRGVLRREVSGDISYPKQRDHSAHTLYNYIMGWYIYSNNQLIKAKIAEHFKIRGSTRKLSDFADLWPFVSLVHDVGYLFEGTLDPLSPDIQSEQVKIGTEVVNDYFHHYFWTECECDSVDEQQRLRRMSNVQEPHLSAHSMARVADALRSLGDLEDLRKSTLQERNEQNFPHGNPDYLNQQGGLLGDAFDLWIRHYESYGLHSMVKRIGVVRQVFEWLLHEGLGGTGLRLLDHGVCSGLLLLLNSTFYFKVYFGLGETPPADINDHRVWDKFINKVVRLGIDIDPLWWWTSIVWATAATALHSIQQSERTWPESLGDLKPLELDEDPLAYLGILVDSIQQWDRTTVSRESVMGGFLPLQGIDVEMSVAGGKISIDYGDLKHSKSVRDDLDIALKDWNKIIDIVQ